MFWVPQVSYTINTRFFHKEIREDFRFLFVRQEGGKEAFLSISWMTWLSFCPTLIFPFSCLSLFLFIFFFLNVRVPICIISQLQGFWGRFPLCLLGLQLFLFLAKSKEAYSLLNCCSVLLLVPQFQQGIRTHFEVKKILDKISTEEKKREWTREEKRKEGRRRKKLVEDSQNNFSKFNKFPFHLMTTCRFLRPQRHTLENDVPEHLRFPKCILKWTS